MHRFRFLARKDLETSFWIIEGEELFHLKKVLRLKLKDEVEVFQENGLWGIGKLTEISNQVACVKVYEEAQEEEKDPALILAIGALQSQSFPDLIPCLVELGLDKLYIFLQEGTAKARLGEKSLARWEKIVLSSMKQCKRARKLVIQTYASLEALMKTQDFSKTRIVMLDPEAKSSLYDLKLISGLSIMMVMGSEKGLLPNELELLRSHQALEMSLTENILRSFTAAIAATSLVSAKRKLLKGADS